MKKKTIEEWERLIAEQASSGKSVMEFCRQHGISDNRLYYWRNRLVGEKSVGKFVKVGSSDIDTVELELEGGMKLKFSVNHTKVVLDALLA